MSAPVHAQATAELPKPIILAMAGDESSLWVKWLWRIYTEAFLRLGRPFEFRSAPLLSQSALSERGYVDGEVGRIHAYGEAHPDLVRVEESLTDLSFSLYTADPILRLKNLDELRTRDLLVEYRSGILFCEKVLTPIVPLSHLSDIRTAQQGLLKLLAGRTDLYCETDLQVASLLSADIPEVGRVRQVLPLGTLPIYPYLIRKHADLAPRLAAVLKQMKAEGLIKAYRAQAEKELAGR